MVDLNEKILFEPISLSLQKILGWITKILRCLDLGSGDGRFVMYILKNYKDAFIEACDIDKNSLKVIEKKLTQNSKKE